MQNVDSDEEDDEGNLGGGWMMTNTGSSYHGHEVKGDDDSVCRHR